MIGFEALTLGVEVVQHLWIKSNGYGVPSNGFDVASNADGVTNKVNTPLFESPPGLGLRTAWTATVTRNSCSGVRK